VIDVRFAIAHGLWILGTAIVLAAFSFYDWLARAEQRRLRDVLREARAWKLSAAGGLMLLASGFLLMEGTRWWAWCGWLVVLTSAGSDLWHSRARS
jgi:uncharacterized membrane protein YqgA involved in biofilm formation